MKRAGQVPEQEDELFDGLGFDFDGLDSGSNFIKTEELHVFQIPLVTAALKGDLDEVNSLLAAGASADEKDGFGSTALIAAASYGHVAIVETLARRVRNLSDVDTFGKSALSAAASRGHDRVVQALIDAGADGFDAMIHAINDVSSESRMASVQLLINAGVNPNGTDAKGTKAVKVACKRGDAPMLDLLISNGAKVDILDRYGRGLLTYGVDTNSLPIVQSLVAQGLDLNQMVNAERNQTILMYATHRGYTEIANFLKERGADQEILDYKGRKASDYASVTKASATPLDQEDKKAKTSGYSI